MAIWDEATGGYYYNPPTKPPWDKKPGGAANNRPPADPNADITPWERFPEGEKPPDSGSTTTPPGGGGGGSQPPSNASPVTPNGQIQPPSGYSFVPNPAYGMAAWKSQSIPGLSNFNAPDQGLYQDALLQALYGMVQNPSADTAGNKEIQKEQALAMGEQAKGAFRQGAASRGTLQGGATGAGLGRIDQNTIANILAAYRDVDLAERQQRLQAVTALDSALTGQTGRAIDTYNTLSAKPLAEAKLGTDVWLGEETGRQFNIAQTLAYLNYLENIRQFDQNMAYNYDALTKGLV